MKKRLLAQKIAGLEANLRLLERRFRDPRPDATVRDLNRILSMRWEPPGTYIDGIDIRALQETVKELKQRTDRLVGTELKGVLSHLSAIDGRLRKLEDRHGEGLRVRPVSVNSGAGPEDIGEPVYQPLGEQGYLIVHKEVLETAEAVAELAARNVSSEHPKLLDAIQAYRIARRQWVGY